MGLPVAGLGGRGEGSADSASWGSWERKVKVEMERDLRLGFRVLLIRVFVRVKIDI